MKNLKLDSIYDSIILLSDIHFGVHASSIEWGDNISNYFNNFFIPYLKEYQKTHTPILIIAGDFFDDRQKLDIDIMNRGLSVVEDLSKILSVHIIAGNHDIYKKNECDINSLVLFKHIENVELYIEPTIVDIRGYKVELIPWVGDYKTETKHVMESESDVLIMHTEIKGCSYDRGQPIINGTEVSAFKGRYIFSGHIHKRQELKNITYIGSPYAMSRSDIDNDKGVYSLEFADTINVSFTPNEYSPKFIQCDISEIYGKDKDKIESILSNNYVDIVCKKSDNKKLSKLMELTEDSGFKKMELKYVKDDVVNNDADKQQRVSVGQSIDVLIVQKIESLKNDGLTKKQIDYLIKKNDTYIKNV